MKKFFTLMFAFYYLFISLGITASVHYCGGKVNRINVMGMGDHKQCCGGKPMKKDCCKDKEIKLKKKQSDEQSYKTVLVKFSPIIECVIPSYQWIQPRNIHNEVEATLVSNHSPPPDGKHPIYIKIRSLLI